MCCSEGWGARDGEVHAVVVGPGEFCSVVVFDSVAGREDGVERVSFNVGVVSDQLFESDVVHAFQEVGGVGVTGVVEVS